MTSETAPLSIGMIIGGRTSANRAWVESVQELMREVKASRKGTESGLRLNIEFHVSGNHLQPEFEGVRTGAFRKADSLLKVQVALSADAPNDPRAALHELLRAALDAADQWVSAKRKPFDLTPLRELVDTLEGGRFGRQAP